MRFSALVVLASAAASVSASSIFKRQFPTCANSCLANAPTGDCQGDDNHCLCLDNDFVANTTECIQTACTGSDLQTALSDAQQLCAAVGVTLTSTFAAPSATSTDTTGTTNGTAASTTPTSPASSGGSSSSSSAPAPSATSNGALRHGASAIALFAIGLAAAAL